MKKEEFAQIVKDTAPVMYRVSKSILKRDEDCEDAAQEAIAKGFYKLETLKNDTFARTWLIRILINECHTILRKRKREAYCEETAKWEKEDYSQLYNALSELPANYRVTIVLHYIEGYSVSETARILNVLEGTVKSRLSRGRKKLRMFLEEDENE
ncbi:RNA polymerase sigma factor SigV [Clostridiales bacterium]|nr:RNA polymerase sigma factor SigV [Clostridiales bacterium]